MQQGEQKRLDGKVAPVLEIRDPRANQFDKFLAYPFLFLLLVKIPGLSVVPVMAFLAILMMLAGLFRPTFRATPGIFRLALAAGIATLSGLLLRFLAPDGNTVNSSFTQSGVVIAWVLAFPAVTAAALWALGRVNLHRGLIVVLLGATLSAYVHIESLSWKGDEGIYTTLLALAFFYKRMNWARLALIGSAILNAVSDSRTMTLICLICLGCTFLSSSRLAWIVGHPKKALVVIVGGFALASYLTTQAMTSGLLGPDVQMRTLNQVSSGNDLITAGRTEWAATVQLFKTAPWGFGVGVTPDSALQTDAVNAVHQAGGDYSNAYYWTVEVFGNRTDLHSELADLWAHFGFGGLLAAAMIAMILASALAPTVGAIRSMGMFPLFAVLSAAWDLLFSPMGNSDRVIIGLIAATVLIRLYETQPNYLIDPTRVKNRKTQVCQEKHDLLTTRKRHLQYGPAQSRTSFTAEL